MSKPPAVQLGLTRALSDPSHQRLLRGKRLGFIGHEASVDEQCRSAVDLLLARQPASETIDPRRLHISVIVLGEGLVMASVGWMLLGASLWAVLQAVLDVPDEPRLMTLAEWGQLSAILSLAYVAGFIVVFMPSGLGVREFFLRVFLLPELSRQWTGEKNAVVVAIWAVLLLRLVWTAAELVTTAIVYWFPGQKPEGEQAV